MQLGSVLVDRCRPGEDRQVAEHVHHNKSEQPGACEGHEVLSAKRCIEDVVSQ